MCASTLLHANFHQQTSYWPHNALWEDVPQFQPAFLPGLLSFKIITCQFVKVFPLLLWISGFCSNIHYISAVQDLREQLPWQHRKMPQENILWCWPTCTHTLNWPTMFQHIQPEDSLFPSYLNKFLRIGSSPLHLRQKNSQKGKRSINRNSTSESIWCPEPFTLLLSYLARKGKN